MDDLNPFLSDLGIINAMGEGKDFYQNNLIASGGIKTQLSASDWGDAPYYHVDAEFPNIEAYIHNNRVNRMLRAAVMQIAPALQKAIDRWGPGRIGVVMGSTDNGSDMALNLVKHLRNEGRFPGQYSLDCQSAHSTANFLKTELGLKGPDMAISTACSSSSVAIIVARELIRSGLCDAVISGGADIVSQAVYMGFSALEAVSPSLCNPFSRNRNGITLGDGAAVFLVSREDLGKEGIRLLGAGESADAYHMTAPDPDGKGAESAMRKALKDAKLDAADVDYVNLHGTGTDLNDSMESKAVDCVFGRPVPCSSTKPFSGHTLGAAGATEAGICWLALSKWNPNRKLPWHHWDGEADPELPELALNGKDNKISRFGILMSNSFAFGGNDTSLIIGRAG